MLYIQLDFLVRQRYQDMQDSNDFSDEDLRVPKEEITFKETSMLVCRWWYPNKPQAQILLDAIFVANAAPSERGVSITQKIVMQLRKVDAIEDQTSISYTNLKFWEFDPQTTQVAIANIENGIDPLFYLYKMNENYREQISSIEPLNAIYEQCLLNDETPPGQTDRPNGPLRV